MPRGRPKGSVNKSKTPINFIELAENLSFILDEYVPYLEGEVERLEEELRDLHTFLNKFAGNLSKPKIINRH